MKTMFFAAVLVLGVAVLGQAQATQDVYPQVHASEFVMGGGPNNAPWPSIGRRGVHPRDFQTGHNPHTRR